MPRIHEEQKDRDVEWLRKGTWARADASVALAAIIGVISPNFSLLVCPFASLRSLIVTLHCVPIVNILKRTAEKCPNQLAEASIGLTPPNLCMMPFHVKKDDGDVIICGNQEVLVPTSRCAIAPKPTSKV